MVLLTRSSGDTAGDGAPTRRRRPVRRALKYLAATAIVGTTATVGVVLLLNHLSGTAPLTERCAAELDGTDWYLSPVQSDNAALIAQTAVRRGLPARAATIALATALQESKLVNITYGDRDSLGLFQQRPSQGWGTEEEILDPVYSTNAFYDGLVQVDGYENMEITDAAQEVQRSAYPEAYARHEVRSRAWASSLTGHSPASLTCEIAPVEEESLLAPAPATDVVAGRLGRDLGLGPSGTSATGAAVVEVDATPLTPGEPGRGGWAVAHWAVATATATNAVEVRVADQVWTRESAEWTASGESLPAGQVQILPAVAE
ncbi:hypothetical protein [Myceligenerans pegani]|uniref:Uncharacterized protein n=1 Tax=Myceligenerans pegani TaxID=2776917 RepID=A0ABR9N0A6_9MICO|nr:hypothetical protein [Myceligenerans sp. TRM 65318]MBE1877083.1 hypothetical protein [Myceligenerans sp. TRM 65318]MBE3019354.1 hypothetical protein [Myceligenerans sp. TRM 65318]